MYVMVIRLQTLRYTYFGDASRRFRRDIMSVEFVRQTAVLQSRGTQAYTYRNDARASNKETRFSMRYTPSSLHDGGLKTIHAKRSPSI